MDGPIDNVHFLASGSEYLSVDSLCHSHLKYKFRYRYKVTGVYIDNLYTRQLPYNGIDIYNYALYNVHARTYELA